MSDQLEVATEGLRSVAGDLSKASDTLASAPSVAGSPNAGRSSGEVARVLSALESGRGELAAAVLAIAEELRSQADRYDSVDGLVESGLINQGKASP